MAESAEGTERIGASAPDVMAVITDFEAYPEWAGVKSAKVLATDEQGRGAEVAYEIDAPVIGSVIYTLAYAYEDDDRGCSWTTRQIEGKIRDIQGQYVLEELDEDETDVTYRLAVDVGIPLPGFMKKEAAKQIVNTGLGGLKKRVEGG